jgi:hypothetical protein
MSNFFNRLIEKIDCFWTICASELTLNARRPAIKTAPD